ncbi:MAG: TatD family hydrolase [Elusimicrobia bacterium]|nr:TatD family hydrolase [Elusimicrobiota bacterium]
MLVDTHVHLTDPQFDADREEALQRALDADVRTVVEIAYHEPLWEKARTLAEGHPGRVFWAAGLHPHHADEFDEEFPRRLAAVLRHPQIVAVGEIGLDYFRSRHPPELQQRVFQALLAAARDAAKPVVLHCREKDPSSRAAQTDMIGILKARFPSPDGLSGVAHCFQGSLDSARALMDLGFFIGVDGPLTYPNASALRAVIKEVPLDRLVLETDCPYLPPQGHRGGRNEPSHIKSVASALAELKNLSPDEVETQTTRNAENLFSLKN